MNPAPDPGCTLRPARADDAGALARLLGLLGFDNAGDALRPRLRQLEAAGDAVWVAERGTVVIGLIALHVMPVLHRPRPVGRITTFVVDPEARGQGVGRALLAHAEQWLQARGCGLVEVTSNRRLTEAHAFYERRGYAFTSLRLAREAIDDDSPPA